MKKITLLILGILLSQTNLLSQSCLPNGIHFKTQEEIDQFSFNYPNCTKIEGLVTIDDTIEGNINNLLGLSSLTKTGGNILRISNNSMLSNLNGLENLDSIEYICEIRNNPSLSSIAALESLVFVPNIFIEENPSLINLEGLNQLDTVSTLSIINNDSLQDLLALSNLKKIRGLLHIESAPLLQNLSGLENLTFVGEDLKIFDNDSLTNLQGLNNLAHIIGVLKVRYNDQLISLDGLENLDTIDSGISINDNMVLSSLEGISDCYFKFSLGIHDNPLLEICNIASICEFLSDDPQYTTIYNNAPGCNSPDEILASCALGVNNLPKNPGILLHPNPANREVSITGDEGIQIDEIIFYNSLGQKALCISHFDNTIDISELKSDIYFIHIVSSQSLISQKLIVKK